MSGNTFDGANALAETLLTNIVGGFDTEQTGASSVFGYSQGASFPPVTTGYDEVVLNVSVTGTVSLPAAYPVLYDGTVNATTVIGGGGDNQGVVAASGGLDFDFNGGSGIIYTGNTPVGDVAATGDTIFLDGAGTNIVAAGEGDDTIVASAGTNYIADGAGANQIFVDGGSNLIGSEGNDQIVMGTGSAAASGAATISLSGSTSVFGGSGALLLLNGAGTTDLFPQTDSLTGVTDNTGSVTVFGGTGGGVYYGGTDGDNIMLAGTQATSLIGGGAGDVLYAFGAGNDVLDANGASAALIGSAGTGDNTYFAGTSDAFIAGGGGADTYVAGTGDSTMISGAGADQYDFTNGEAGGVDVIYGFKVGTDQVNLFGYDTDSVSAAVNALAQSVSNTGGGSTYVTLADHTTIYFLDTPQLASNSFTG
jgi:Ca2+-binding RTX toxin-like protein